MFEVRSVQAQLDGQCRNLIQFAFWSGLRTSELIALRWQDIDLDNKRVYIRTTIVRQREKTTKTASGQRTIELQPDALEALQSQLKLNPESERVFHDPATNAPWLGDHIIRKRIWIPALETAGVQYRNPYQTRHTFASMLLSKGKNPLWVAQQMGHKDWGMLRKVYGRWIS
ncbi:site-specific integrase [Marinobacterium halophilum]|uniref:site-specific integrase n=1 Tax=Marinobacterium halophilum TaxID=267374 RepID=UPI001B801233|nr:site-specific integrase [Marinobacterium halophilum]